MEKMDVLYDTVQSREEMTRELTKSQGQGLEVTALVFGILALVICCCNGLFGGIGLVLSIVALAKGRKNGKSIAGLICSLLGLVGALVVLAFAFTDTGKEMKDAFWEGFEKGYESTSGQDIHIGSDEQTEEMDEVSEQAVVSNAGTKTYTKEESSLIVVDGRTLQLPFQLKDILDAYEVDEMSETDMESGLDAHMSTVLFFVHKETGNAIVLSMNNNTEEKIADIKDAYVTGVSVDEGQGSASVLGMITMDMTEKELEEVIKDLKYNKSGYDGYVFYDIYPCGEPTYAISVMLKDDKVCSLNLYYSE